MPKLTPRPYLSYSQFRVFKSSEKQYIKKYIYGDDFGNNATSFGKIFHRLLENKEDSEDPVIEHVRNFTPIYPNREFEVRVDFKDIPLFGVLDGFHRQKFLVGDYKTGKMWTQQQVDDDEQLTFYATMLWLIHNKIPKLELTSIESKWEDDEVQFTGNI